MPELPSEIWSQIFDLAADEDILFLPGIPTAMAESAWYRDIIVNEWRLRSPREAMNMLQRRSYATKKVRSELCILKPVGLTYFQAIISTCRQWRGAGSEFLFRCLYFSDPAKMISLSTFLDVTSDPEITSPSWWTRRIHISRYHPSPSRRATIEDMDQALVSIVSHCPNLEIFVMERPMGSAFGPVVDALATHAFRKLHTVHWNIPGEALAKVIWALDSLPLLIAVHVDFETPVPSIQETANLGSATNLPIMLPFLKQLSLRGYVEEMVEQCTGWDLPALCNLSVDSGTSVQDIPDIVEFLKNHGPNLSLLDLNVSPLLDIRTILDLCPNLSTFTFNADWRVMPHDDAASELTTRPHPNITTIGLHGLSHAFGVGFAAAVGNLDPVRSRVMCRSNDLNVAALNKANFPKLQRVRALNRNMLSDLNKENGPSIENGGYERWNKWWNRFASFGITLEDCTGQALGTLPDEDQEESEEEEESDEDEDVEEEEEEEEEESDSEGWGSEVDDSSFPALPAGNGRTMELTRLLQEVRAMNEGRDEKLIARIRIERPPSPE